MGNEKTKFRPSRSLHLNKTNRTDRLSRFSLFNRSNSSPMKETERDTYSIGQLIPERYLVLLTEQMTEMLFRLMNFTDSSLINSIDQNVRSSFSIQPVHQICVKCQMKMLTIEEFHELHKAFRQVDADHDQFLTREEIRLALNYLFDLTEYDVKEIISVFNTDQDDRISFEEYIEEMKHRLLHQLTRDEIKFAFDQTDSQQLGHIRVEDLKIAVAHLNFHLPYRQLIEIVNDCTKNESNKMIDLVLFTNIVRALHRREPITLQKFKTIHHDLTSN